MNKKLRRAKTADLPGIPSTPPPRASAHAKERSTEAALASARWYREAIESIVIAIVLALLFRTFEAEAFIIPTGSMAPTLRGQHKDVACPACGYWHQAGASAEEDTRFNPVSQTVCPMCFRPREIPSPLKSRHRSFSGDRILVNKLAYQFGEPKRWDVIVFKYPENAKQSYIKRLVGLPGETVRIHDGDIYVKKADETDFHIERKPAELIPQLLQSVHDTRYTAEDLVAAGWRSRWQSENSGWQVSPDQKSFTSTATTTPSWLRYRHVIPSAYDWESIGTQGRLPEQAESRPQLISDFYGYNAKLNRDSRSDLATAGGHWVGDLAVECALQLTDAAGSMTLQLVKAGRRFDCHIDLTTGLISLTQDQGAVPFEPGEDGQENIRPQAESTLNRPGSYRLRFANVDQQLLVWIDGRLCEFDRPTTYTRSDLLRPHWTPEDPGDLLPVGIATEQAAVQIDRLQVWRDIYYIAVNSRRLPGNYPTIAEYGRAEPIRSLDRLADHVNHPTLEDYFAYPEAWQEGDLFDQRATVDFPLGDDQFFPLGDNSPSSQDGRLWDDQHFVPRDLLVGRAFFTYWPHGLLLGIPGTDFVVPRSVPAFIPNPARMRLIR